MPVAVTAFSGSQFHLNNLLFKEIFPLVCSDSTAQQHYWMSSSSSVLGEKDFFVCFCQFA